MALISCQLYNKFLYGPLEECDKREKRFQEDSKRIVNHLVKSFEQVNPGSFRDIIAELAETRRKIAEQEGTPNASLFGTSICDTMDEGTYSFTPLVQAYQNVAERAIKDLAEVLGDMKHTKKEFIEKSREVNTNYGDRQFSTTYEYLQPSQIAEWSVDIDPENGKNKNFLEEVRRREEKVNPEKDNLPAEIKESRKLYRKFGVFKEMFPNSYKQGRMHCILKFFQENFPSQKMNNETKKMEENHAYLKSDFVLVTMRVLLPKANGEKAMFATNQLITFLYRNFNEDPVQRMLDKQPPMIAIHQDVYLNDSTLNECSQSFDEILNLPKDVSVEELKDKVAFLRYLFAQCMPYRRGGAAIGEWLEGAIYQKFGYQCTYRPSFEKDSVDTAAMTSFAYSTYLNRYNQLVNLEKIH